MSCSGCAFPSWPVRRRGRVRGNLTPLRRPIALGTLRPGATAPPGRGHPPVPPRPSGPPRPQPGRPGRTGSAGRAPPPFPGRRRGRVQNKSGGRGRGEGRGGGYKGRRRAAASRPCSPGADGSGRPAPRRGPRAAPLPLRLLLLLPPPPLLLARAPRPPVSARRPAAPARPPSTPRGAAWQAGPTGAPGSGCRRYPETLSGCPGGVVDGELPVWRYASGTDAGIARAGWWMDSVGRWAACRPPQLPDLPPPARPRSRVCVCSRRDSGRSWGLPAHCRDKDPWVSSWRQPPGVWPR